MLDHLKLLPFFNIYKYINLIKNKINYSYKKYTINQIDYCFVYLKSQCTLFNLYKYVHDKAYDAK